jgi:hypothetical protein
MRVRVLFFLHMHYLMSYGRTDRRRTRPLRRLGATSTMGVRVLFMCGKPNTQNGVQAVY